MTVTDGIVVLTTESYERAAVAALRKWYSDMEKSAYIVGLPLAHGSHASSGEKIQSKEAGQIETFLDNALKTSGEKSLLYVSYLFLAEDLPPLCSLLDRLQISFGSLYWPMNDLEKVWAFLDVVMERSLHFLSLTMSMTDSLHEQIMTHASPFAHVPDAVKDKVQAYGQGILSPWAPQQLILGHPVSGSATLGGTTYSPRITGDGLVRGSRRPEQRPRVDCGWCPSVRSASDFHAPT